MHYVKPKVLISKCIEFDACRYDGQIITNKNIAKLKQYINFITVCPEVEIGMGIPRDPIRVINNKNKLSLYQRTTKKDYGSKMVDFSIKYLKSIDHIDGILLKSKSPSCAINTAKYYPDHDSKISMGTGPGLFAKQLMDQYPDIPKEEEVRLNDVYLREHFYISIFVIADYRKINNFQDLYKFHAKHKLLFMTYNQYKLKKLGQIAANHSEKNFSYIKEKYFNVLLKIFSRRPKYVSHINTQMHAYGFYKDKLSKKEKDYFLNLLSAYREKTIPVSALNSVLYAWNTRFEEKYLINQSYFSPFPKQLIESGK